MSGVNLLPWRDWAWARRRRRFAVQLVAAGVTGLALALGIGVLFHGAAAQEAARNARLAERISEADQRLAEAAQLRERETHLLSRLMEFEHLRAGRSTVARVLDALPRTLADGLHFDSITRTGNSLQAAGTAASVGRISALMRNIEHTGVFSEPTLKHVEERSAAPPYGAGAVGFELEFSLAATNAPASAFEARQ